MVVGTHNCVRFVPESQNRGQHSNFRDYLRGRIAWVEATNETRARRLMAVFERIKWSE
jgi:hypothetical protein